MPDALLPRQAGISLKRKCLDSSSLLKRAMSYGHALTARSSKFAHSWKSMMIDCSRSSEDGGLLTHLYRCFLRGGSLQTSTV